MIGPKLVFFVVPKQKTVSTWSKYNVSGRLSEYCFEMHQFDNIDFEFKSENKRTTHTRGVVHGTHFNYRLG